MVRLATATSVASCLFVCIVRSPVLLAQATATICRCSLVWYSGTGLTPAASAPGVGLSATSSPRLGRAHFTLHLSCRRLTAEAHLCRDWGSLCHICTGIRQVAAAECGGAYPFASDPAAAADFALRVLRGLQRAPAARGRHTCHTTRRMRAAPTPLVLGEHRCSTYVAALSRLRRFMLPRWSATRVVAAVLAESGVSPAEKMATDMFADEHLLPGDA